MKKIVTVLALITLSICAEARSQSMQDMHRRQEAITSRCDQKSKDNMSTYNDNYLCVNGNNVVGANKEILGQLGVEKVGSNGKVMFQIEGDELVMYLCSYPCENITRLPAAKQVISHRDAAKRKETESALGEKISTASDYKDQDSSVPSASGTCSWNGVSEQCSAE